MGLNLCRDSSRPETALLSLEDDSEPADNVVFKSGGNQQKSGESPPVEKKSRERKRPPYVDTERKPSLDGSDEEKNQDPPESKPIAERTAWNPGRSEYAKEDDEIPTLTKGRVKEEKEENSALNVEICSQTQASLTVLPIEKSPEPGERWLTPDDDEDFRDLRMSKISLPDFQLKELPPQFGVWNSAPRPSKVNKSKERLSQESLFHDDSHWTDEKVSHVMKEMSNEIEMLARTDQEETSDSSTGGAPDNLGGITGKDNMITVNFHAKNDG